MNQKSLVVIAAVCVAMLFSVTTRAEDELAALRAEVAKMRADYESRIAALERRLEAAEHNTAAPAYAEPSPPRTTASTSGRPSSAFNPALGVIFEGGAWSYDRDPGDYAIPGFPLGGESGPAEEGLALGETEINISANVDDLFTAWLTVPVHIEDGEAHVEIEEAWVETLRLPAGLSARFGRMFSDVGYLNEKHAHAWDFADMPLPYQAFLGNQYIDDGLRVSWVAPTDLYLQLSGEVMRGDRYPFVGAANSGVGAYTLRARLGGDVGASHSWQAGLSWLSGESIERDTGHGHAEEDHDEHGDEHDDEHEFGEGPLLFTGDTDLMIADLVWKWAPNGNWRQRNFKFALEYMQRREQGHYLLPDGDESPWDVDQDGWYAEAVYQFRPQWRIGVRFDTLSGDDPGPAFDDTPLAPGLDDPMRYSLMADWSHSEFSRLRLQYTRDEAGASDDNQFGLQYIFSIGAHGAHSF